MRAIPVLLFLLIHVPPILLYKSLPDRPSKFNRKIITINLSHLFYLRILYQCKDNWRISLWATYQQQADAALVAATAHGSSFSFFSSAAVEMTTAAETVSSVEMMAADLVVETALASSSFYFFFAAAVETATAIQDAVAAANSTFQHAGDLKVPCFFCRKKHIIPAYAYVFYVMSLPPFCQPS